MNLNKTYRNLLASIESGQAWVLLFVMGLFNTFRVFRLIVLQFLVQKISITPVVVQPIIYRKKFTVFQRGAVNCK
ncbi:MAG: hypothetical protein WBJ10_15990 [Daejeonella sp.]|uniref:hypothetical protein n=1 Tax=Daejeonella sp. TaxID=2805397 RepID=UPI003C75158E